MKVYTNKKQRRAIRKAVRDLVDGTYAISDWSYYTNEDRLDYEVTEFIFMDSSSENGWFYKKGIPTLFLGNRHDLYREH